MFIEIMLIVLLIAVISLIYSSKKQVKAQRMKFDKDISNRLAEAQEKNQHHETTIKYLVNIKEGNDRQLKEIEWFEDGISK
ncbi:hypothetical protein MM326_19020 [Alkalihalobacillus sp. LMS6]|uniref:hypothetical protein n=1 Tax=Alkalihalobacillus sp. LMS6 TaxID=2924034 RepID=UPI0020D0A764|nr:hypothetical protein [Alkalihalobacillus sp. LMS6]UTR06142.1 hypothetical protein MM326_19020 [Alkalihalobacillus sp. LMS6]